MSIFHFTGTLQTSRKSFTSSAIIGKITTKSLTVDWFLPVPLPLKGYTTTWTNGRLSILYGQPTYPSSVVVCFRNMIEIIETLPDWVHYSHTDIVTIYKNTLHFSNHGIFSHRLPAVFCLTNVCNRYWASRPSTFVYFSCIIVLFCALVYL